jgi:hypothetical protein
MRFFALWRPLTRFTRCARMADAGYVRIHRKMFGHPTFRNDSEALAFAWMVAKASWKDTRVRYKEHTITLKRGDLSVSIRDLAAVLDRPKGWVERLILRLKNETMIETRRATGGKTAPLIISVTNYDTYQSIQDRGETRDGTGDRPRRGTATGQRPDREQGREEVNKKELASASSRASRLSPSFEPSDGTGKMAEIAARWSPAERGKELERWRAHHSAKGTKMIDWDAAWQTWIGNSEKFGGRQKPLDFGYGAGHSGIPI